MFCRFLVGLGGLNVFMGVEVFVDFKVYVSVDVKNISCYFLLGGILFFRF